MSSATANGPLFVVAGKAGQLGNRLFFFSYVLELAMKLGGRAANPGFIDYAQLFAGTSRDALSRWPAQTSALTGKRPGCWIYELQNFFLRVVHRLRLRIPGVKILGLHEAQTAEYRLDHAPFLDSLRAARVVFISGWLELRHVRFEHPQELRAYFAPVERHRAAVADLIQRARARCEVLIGVHIRQGDYAHFLNGRYCFDTERYIHAMREVAALFPKRKMGFLICSNEPQQIADSALSFVIAGPGHPIEDMYALAACDYIIGPPSTFSLWASFYGQTPLWEMQDGNSTPKLEEFLLRF